ARCALRAAECRQSVAAASLLAHNNVASIHAISDSIQHSGRLLEEARNLSHAQASTSARGFFTMGTAPASKKYNQRRLVGWTPEQLYTVVSRVEDYYKFVPWCQRSTVVKPASNNYMEAELEVGFQVLVERYTSQVFLAPGRSVRSRVADSSLFHHLDSTWTMEAGPTPRTCWLSFSVDFAFRSQLHGYLADIFFNEVVKQMSGAFEGRCATLYGPSSLISPPVPAAGQRPRHPASAAAGAGAGAGVAAGRGAGGGGAAAAASGTAAAAAHGARCRCSGHAHNKATAAPPTPAAAAATVGEAGAGKK
ncbi:hypothetical protein Agub_g12524, partial [Astrephomene gubernaculifera]